MFEKYSSYWPQRSCGQGNIFTPVCHSFCSQGGRGSASVHAGIPPTPHPRSRSPPDQTPPHPPPRSRPPQTRHHLPPGPDTPRADTPLEQTPPGADPPQTRHHPPGKQTPAYGLRAAGTHPTGMHSCFSKIKYARICAKQWNMGSLVNFICETKSVSYSRMSSL